MPKRLARAPGAGRRSGGRTAAKLPSRNEDRSASAKPGCAASRAAWSGQPRNSVARSRCKSSSVAAGSGSASVSRVAPATSAVSRPCPNPPVQKKGIGMYRRSPGPTPRAASPDATARKAAPWVWITPFGVPRLPEVNSTTMSSAGRTRCSSARTRLIGALASGMSSVVQTRRSDGAAGWRPPPRTAASESGTGVLELVQVVPASELRRRHEVGHVRRGQLRQQLSAAAAGCS